METTATKTIELDGALCPEAEPAVLLPTDTCDRCGPAVTANTAVRLAGGGLLTLCNHDYDTLSPALAALEVSVVRNEVR